MENWNLYGKMVLINNYDNVAMDGNKIELQGYQFLVIEM